SRRDGTTSGPWSSVWRWHMTDDEKPPETAPEPAPATPPLPEPTAEEIEAARIAAVEANDAAVDAELRGRTRRGFIVAGIAAAAGLGGWKWLNSRPREDDVPWPLRRVLEANERLAGAYFSPNRLSPT